mgnify:CR=1 FL=1
MLIHTQWIKLDQFLKFAGAADTGGHGKEMVLNGQVSVNGEICLQRGKKIHPGDTVAVDLGGGDGIIYSVKGGES